MRTYLFQLKTQKPSTAYNQLHSPGGLAGYPRAAIVVGQFREFDSPHVHTRIDSYGLFKTGHLGNVDGGTTFVYDQVTHWNSVFAIKVVRPKFTQNPPEGTKLNELYKKRRGTSQMSEQFGPNFGQGPFALQQLIRLVYTLRALS